MKPKKLYFTALSIVYIVFLLLVFIGVSTYRNINMNRKHILTSTYRQGIVMLQTIEAAARAVMMPGILDDDAIGHLIIEVGKNSEIENLYLTNINGIIKHHNNPELDGKKSDWMPNLSATNGVATRFNRVPGGIPVYEIATRFSLFPVTANEDSLSDTSRMNDDILILGLKMTPYETARREDINHAVVMSAILIALAAGAIFFTFVIRNYHLMNKMLKQTQEYTDQVVANMANGLLSTNASGAIMSYNQLALELLGLNEADALNADLGKILNLKTSGILSTLTSGAQVIDREVLHHLPDGRKVNMALSVTPIKDKSSAGKGAVVIIRDLREIKRLEEKVRRTEKLAAIGKLSAVVAHEIRNPLSSIRGFAQFLCHILKNNPKDMEYAMIMVQEVDRINRVVNDLLTFSRQVELRPVPTDIYELISHTIRLLEGDTQATHASIQNRVSEHIGLVRLDPDQFKQVLLNLALNALHELSEGDTLIIGARRNKSGNGTFIWVEDNGPGIQKKHQKKIFDLFYTTRDKGTGLGLAIVQKIIEDHGGLIRLTSPVPGKNKGCRFTIFMPNS